MYSQKLKIKKFKKKKNCIKVGKGELRVLCWAVFTEHMKQSNIIWIQTMIN